MSAFFTQNVAQPLQNFFSPHINNISAMPQEQRYSVITALAAGTITCLVGLRSAFKSDGLKAKATALLVSAFGATVVMSQYVFLNTLGISGH